MSMGRFRITWRPFLTVGLTVGLALATEAGAGAPTAKEPITLTFVSFGGAYQDAQREAWLKPYMRENPHVKIVEDTPPDYAKFRAMVESGNVTWDVVTVANDFGLKAHEKYLEPIDCKVVPCHEMIEDLGATAFRVPTITAAFVLAYRTDKFPKGSEPKGWADFFDLQKYRGKRGCYNRPTRLLPIALVADGVPPEKVHPLDVDRALRKMDTIKSQCVWWDTGAQSAKLLADGEVVMGMTFNGRAQAAASEGAPITIQWSQFLNTPDYLVVPKGTKHKAEAMKLIAYITSKEHSADLSKYIAYGPVNKGAAEKTDPKMKEWLSTSFPRKNGFSLDDEWWSSNVAAVTERYRAWFQQK